MVPEKKASKTAAPDRTVAAPSGNPAPAGRPLRPAPSAARSDAKPAAKPAAGAKAPTRTRRPRLRIQSDGVPVANWLNIGEKPRPSSFIPAPPRAEAPSLIAAPPASSDRLVRPEDLSDGEATIRTFPVRVAIEQGAGHFYIGINPERLEIKAGEGIEWDFHYIGGADVVVDEIVIEFNKPSPFGRTSFKSQKPGSARPHRQISGPAVRPSGPVQIQYTIRCFNLFKSQLAVAHPILSIV